MSAIIAYKAIMVVFNDVTGVIPTSSLQALVMKIIDDLITTPN